MSPKFSAISLATSGITTMLVTVLVSGCSPEDAATEAPGSTTGDQQGTTEPELPTTTVDPTTSSTDDMPSATTETGVADSTGSSSTGAWGPICGDGIVEGDEACDDGTEGNTLTGACLPGCMLATCGDGLVQAGVDECDMGAANNFEYGGCNATTCKFNSRCGDGDLDPPHEVCDPGAPTGQDEIECDNACRFAGRIVFLSSAQYTGNLGGLAAADKLCQGLAKTFDLSGAPSYRAWLSDADSSPLQRFDHGPDLQSVPYVLRNGLQVAADFDDLIANGPSVPITLTETGETLTQRRVWTNTGVDGDVFSSSNHCGDWGSASLKDSARSGLNSAPEANLSDWKLYGQWTSHLGSSCFESSQLYCFEN